MFNISTLGFRGEALPSIASGSKVILKTCNDKIGTKVIIENKEIKIGIIINNFFLKRVF